MADATTQRPTETLRRADGDAAVEGLLRRLRRTAADLEMIDWESDRKNVLDAIDMLMRCNAGTTRAAAIAPAVRESTKPMEERRAAFDEAFFAPPSRLPWFLWGAAIGSILAVLVERH